MGPGRSGTFRNMRLILNIGMKVRVLPALLALALPALATAGDAGSSNAGTGAPPRSAVEARFEPAPREGVPEHGKAFTGDATPVEPGKVELEIAYAPSWWATAGAVDRLSC